MRFGAKSLSVQFFYIGQNEAFEYCVIFFLMKKEWRGFQIILFLKLSVIKNRAHKFFNNLIVVFASIQNVAIDKSILYLNCSNTMVLIRS